MTQFPKSTIGVFDSGIGGLSVLRAVHQLLPEESFIYVGDQAHVPYGMRPLAQVQTYSKSITQYLIDNGAKLIVVACNTASAAALQFLRKTFPRVPFVGMEPAVKPAVEHTRSGVVGVLATPTTFQGKLYNSVLERFAQNVTVLQATCPGLVNQIEQGKLGSKDTRIILESALSPMIENGVDRVVMGCTHYPFAIPLIKEIVGHEVEVIDPAPAIARQVMRLLNAHHLREASSREGQILLQTTGDLNQFLRVTRELVSFHGLAQSLQWNEGDLPSTKEDLPSLPF